MQPLSQAGSHAREVSLGHWLDLLLENRRQRNGGPVVVGGTGHLLLSETESLNATIHLSDHVLPQIARQIKGRGVMLLSGAAPGADLLFFETAQTWFVRSGIPCTTVALLPVPPQWLIDDWQLRAQSDGHVVLPEARLDYERRLGLALLGADLLVPLFTGAGEQESLVVSWREEQYRKLAACLAEQSDILIAVLRAQNLREPGGTAEVVEWRRHLRRIPARLSTLFRDDAMSPAQRHPLIVIDPRVPADGVTRQAAAETLGAEADALLAQAEEALRGGNDLLCHDILDNALRRGLRNRRIEYLHILSLATSGSTDLALEHYRGLHLAPDEMTEDWLALQGRLEKDLALSGRADPQRHFAHAATAYLHAYRRWKGHYSGINAASMNLMADRAQTARDLATEVMEQLRDASADDEVGQYYLLASKAEAALLLGREDLCQERLRDANELLVDDINRRGRTVRQLRRLCQRLEVDPAMLTTLELPPVVLMRRDSPWCAPGEAVVEYRVSLTSDVPPGALVFAGLADPRDLVLAEALLDQGARYYPTLPARAPELQNTWLEKWGSAWTERLAAVLGRAERIAFVPGFLEQEDEWCAHHLYTTSLGLSVLTACRLCNVWKLLDVQLVEQTMYCRAYGEVPDAVDNPDAVLAIAGFSPGLTTVEEPPERRMVGILFADFAGFRRIADPDLPRFWADIMGAMGDILEQYGDAVLLRSTWGDALHVVTSDAITAACIAADIQRFVERGRGHDASALSDLELRIAAHYAPAYEGVDPVRRLRIYYGSQLSFTARIEPIAPPGMIFGSEAFVARLALEAPREFRSEYAGEVELAKRYGKYRLFGVQRVV